VATQSPAFGFINALKPPGPTSTSFGGWVRRQLQAPTLGHWGTLDPAACGVLVLAVGKAARLLPYLPGDDKSYVFELRVGAATDTADATGRILRRAPVPADWSARLHEAAASLVGSLDQVPPMYSAVKIDGRPLYKSARAGRAVERPARRVKIIRLRVIAAHDASARLMVECSAGTYIRTLCEQIGDRLGLPAHLGMLLRTRAGPFDLAHARTPSEIAHNPGQCMIDPLTVLALERIDVDDAGAARFAHGNDVAMSHCGGREPAQENESSVLVVHEGTLIGVATLGATLVPLRVLARAEEND
jgi:tRNA pseudouridine55 synthase